MPGPKRRDSRVLYEIISTVASSLDLGRVLGAVVDVLSDASGVHACFVYIVDDVGERLVLRAASAPYSHLVGEIALERGEGLAWWVAERGEPAFIRDRALDDPRVKYVPELEEEKFQSLISVPIVGKDGGAIGVISLHTEAPREFTPEEVEFLVSSASLVAGAVENARLYEETRRRVHELEHLNEIGETTVRAATLVELLPEVAERSLELFRARACHLYLLEPASELLHLRASAPADAEAPEALGLAELGPELARTGHDATVAVALVADRELVGVLRAEGTSDVALARTVANQTALAIKKIELIEHLAEKNLIKDFFEQLAEGRLLADVANRAQRLGCDLDVRHLVVAATPPSDRLERALANIAPGALVDRRDDLLRALLRVPPAGESALLDTLRRLASELDDGTAIGVSNPCRGAASFRAGFEEARHALLGTSVLRGRSGLMTYDELGPYKYLLRMSLDAGMRDAHRDAVARLAEYDGERGTSLLKTLEEFLDRRGSISATSDALYVHPNTLRQRLRRIFDLTGIDLRKDDWLMIEIAVKLVTLQRSLGAAEVRANERTRL